MTTRVWSQENGTTAEAEAPRKAAVRSARARAGDRSRLSFLDAALLGLIGIVVVLVSLPRLRDFALHENERDAIQALRILSEDAQAHLEILAGGDLAGLLAANPAHRLRLEDVEVLEARRLRRHGYVFAVMTSDSGTPVIVGWPWEHGRSGLGVFAIAPGGEPLALSNEDGRFSGLDRPPPPPSSRGADDDPVWVPLPP